MQEKTHRGGPALAAAAFALVLAGCSSDSGPFTKSDQKHDWGLTRPDWSLFTRSDPKGRTLTALDLIGPDGRCAGYPAAPPPNALSPALNFTAGPAAPGPEANPPPGTLPPGPGAPPVVRGVGLGMTECEVIGAIGYTDRIEISSNERGQRRVVLTYPQGERPGIYRFVSGQLVSIERTAEPPPAPPKQVKSKKTAKKQPPS